MRRRTYLTGVTMLAVSLAGCGGGDTETTDGETDDGPSDDSSDNDPAVDTTTDQPADDDSRTTPPSVAFSFDYVADGDGTGELTIYHESGETVRAASLILRGDFHNVASGGTWLDYQGMASGTVDGDPALTAGDSVTVPVESGYEMNVVWETSGESALLATNQGPDA